MRNDFFGEMAETGGVPLNASPVRRWAGVFGHRPFAFSISMGVKTSDGMNWNLQDLVYEALSEEWRKRDGEISDPWANDEADGYQPPSYEPVNPEQVKALALRMAEQRERAAEDPTQDTNRPEPSGDEPLDLSEPEDLGESGPFESRQAPRTKADLLNEIRQRADRRTGQQEAEQRQIDPWQVQPPQRRGHGR